ncbi:hypothetical protein J7T55_009083 [Diaporthe amygdali]|uniref:uncharacterized protein n=1 Tax=Phomopsis amygdali TaxID=1214568 RepID=UPI0022FE83CD|nr:uncharacterized protein J7T55_009083 [Diaporthe amygdali]KAJ0118300.1 hypothetical protein J7T55_009083 [Diaporthe amygdali]
MAATAQSGQGQGHLADNLEKQLNEIMVQMGRIFQAPNQHPERAEQIVLNAKKKMGEATDSFHSTLDEMEIEITRAKAVFMRDLQKLQDKQKAAVPSQAQPPAPMVIDLDPPKAEQASVPVAPMMASVSPFMQNRPNPKVPEVTPVAPFPDMGMGMGTSTPTNAATVPFHPVKPTEQKRPSPKPAPKSGPPSGRLATKPSPLINSQKQKVPATVPPAASAVVPPPAAPQQAPNPPPASNPFTNATFTLDPVNNEPQVQTGGQDTAMDLTGFDTTSGGLDNLDLGGPIPGGNTEPVTNNNNVGNDTSMDDLDHFFDLGEESTTNFDDNFNSMNEFMNDDFAFDTFE